MVRISIHLVMVTVVVSGTMRIKKEIKSPFGIKMCEGLSQNSTDCFVFKVETLACHRFASNCTRGACVFCPQEKILRKSTGTALVALQRHGRYIKQSTEPETESVSVTNNDVTITPTMPMETCGKPVVECPTNDGYTMDGVSKLCFKIFNNSRRMASAKEFCRKSHTAGRIVVPNTSKKMNALKTACQAYPRVQGSQIWLGAERREDGTLGHWSDGSIIDSSFWNKGEPNNWRKSEGCVTMDSRHGYLFNDENCNSFLNYICEVPMC